MSDWTSGPLDSYLERITYGFTNPMPTTSVGPFMVTAKDVNFGRILYEQARRTSWDAYNGLLTAKSRPKVGDVLVTKDGTLGRIAVVDREDVCINQSVALLRPSDRIKPQFLKYLLEEPNNFAKMLGDADGSTIKHIYVTRLAKMEVSVPNAAEQDKRLTHKEAF
ncbi:MAG: restriction endonuclease subunit S [Pseudomonadota bacterium]